MADRQLDDTDVSSLKKVLSKRDDLMQDVLKILFELFETRSNKAIHTAKIIGQDFVTMYKIINKELTNDDDKNLYELFKNLPRFMMAWSDIEYSEDAGNSTTFLINIPSDQEIYTIVYSLHKNYGDPVKIGSFEMIYDKSSPGGSGGEGYIVSLK